MKTAIILAAVCACAMSQSFGGGKPVSCAASAGAQTRPTDVQKAAAMQCVMDFAVSEGVDVSAAKLCLKDCPKPERSEGGEQGGKGGAKGKGKGGLKELAEKYGVTKEMGQCFKKAAMPIVQQCVASTGVEMQVPEARARAKGSARANVQAGGVAKVNAEANADADVKADRESRREMIGAARGGKGGNGQRRGNNGFNVQQIAERVESCGAPAKECLKLALGPLGADVNVAVVAFKQAKDKCFEDKLPARVEKSAECKADMARIMEALESAECDLETKLTAEARTCDIPEEAIAAMKKLRDEQKASRAARVEGRNKRAATFFEEFDL